MIFITGLISPFTPVAYADWEIDTPTDIDTPIDVDTPTRTESLGDKEGKEKRNDKESINSNNNGSGDEDCSGIYGFIYCNVTPYTGNIYDGIKGFPSMLSAMNGYYLKPANLPPWVGQVYRGQAYEVIRNNWLKLGNIGEGVPSYSRYITRSHSQFSGIFHGVGKAAKGNAVIGGLLNMTQTTVGAIEEYRTTGQIKDKTKLAADLIVDFGVGATAGVISTAAGAAAAAGVGAAVGSVVPGLGTAVGFGVGLGIALFLSTDTGQAITNSLKRGTKKVLDGTIETGKKVVNGAKKAWNTVSGWFS
ncbi:hypothetical protein ACFQ40_07380 [Kroppenstedtia eburnea]|uniref:hypothetical protein n=1 Tax=Kroppenstedtia eburnea TaxID=714067 RepID=UPI003642F5F7